MRILCVIIATLFVVMQDASEEGLQERIKLALTDPCYSVLSYYVLDLDKDSQDEIIVITSESSDNNNPVGGELCVFRKTESGLTLLWSKTGLNPWKLEIGDVDGDGWADVAVGVWTKSPFDPVMAKRPFFYNWDGKSLQPKWLGSRLSRRFDDFMLFDINSDGWDELIALEIMDDASHRVAVYRWDVFGFEWLGCSEMLPELISLGVESGVPVVFTLSNQFEIIYNNNHLELIAYEREESDERKN